MLHKHHLPESQDEWGSILCPAMGSGDPYGRQLNGMGGGISSLSKVVVVSPSNREDIDIDYTFVQVGIEDQSLDLAGNCGNMSSAVAPFALNEGLVPAERIQETIVEEQGQRLATVRLFNTNTNKVIHSKIAVSRHQDGIRYEAKGDFSIDGVSSTASPVALSFLNPAGSKTGKLLPSGSASDKLQLTDGTTISASLVDISNPAVFVRAHDVGVALPCSGDELNSNKALMAKLEDIRRAGAARMGLDPDVQSIPKILLLSEPGEEDIDIRTLALSMQKCHKAVPLTLALNLGVSCAIEGTLPHSLRRQRKGGEGSRPVTIGHASGTLDVQAEMENGEVKSAILMRTARMLMKGEVNCE